MQTVTTQPSTISRATQSLKKALLPLLSAEVQDFMLQLSSIPQPVIEFTPHSITIRNLPANLTVNDIDESFIGKTCHELKHVYADGDRSGKTSAQRKLRKGQLLENNTIRMCLTYVYTLRKVSDMYQDLVINFIPSFTKENPPKFIENFNRAELSKKELKKIRRENRLIKVEENQVTTWREMNAEELATQQKVFIGTCYEEIKGHLDALYEGFNNTAATPIECYAQA